MTDFATAFEEHRSHLRLVAHRMLGSATEADGTVQHRRRGSKLMRADTSMVENLRWPQSTSRRRPRCLHLARSHGTARGAARGAPEPYLRRLARDGGLRELADSVGLALLVALQKR